MPRKISSRKAQSLLETVVAISILIVGAVSIVALLQTMIVARTAAEYETVATNLGRESVEVVHNIRDTNWINNLPFDQGMFEETRYVLSFDPTNADGLHTAGGWRLSPATTDDKLAVVRFTSGSYTGFYTQVGDGETAPWATGETLFSRVLYLTDICSDGTIMAAGMTCAASSKISAGINISSVVTWNERGRVHTSNIQEKIYDWR